MDLTKYTNDSLTKLLHKSITDENYELASMITKELEGRFGNDTFMSKDTQIDIILNEFRFERIHDVMVFLDWKWARSPFGVPVIEDLMLSLKLLYSCLAESSFCFAWSNA